jgi:predicted nucleotidyltransferase
MGLLAERRAETAKRLHDLRETLSRAASVVQDKACVYLTGSVARGEAGKHSDLDLFIVGLTEGDRRKLSRLDEIVLKADLIDASRKHGFPDFSGDGQYLEHYTVSDLCDRLGEPDDDARNTFTARLLLLLESTPLVGPAVYKRAIGDVIAEYWRDYEGHSGDFVPAFLANDIMRLWKTFCVNYEARTEREPDAARAKRKLHNYKLKHSRMLTCYSGLLYLSAVFAEKGTVSPEDAVSMADLAPTARLEWLRERRPEVKDPVEKLLGAYEQFLSDTDAPKDDLIARFMDKGAAQQFMARARDFGDRMFDLLNAVANASRFYRFIVV